MKINQDRRRRIGALKVQGKTVIQQKAELEALIQARQQEVGVLRREVERLREERVGWEMERERAEKVEASIPKPDVKAPTARSATVSTDTTRLVRRFCVLKQSHGPVETHFVPVYTSYIEIRQ